MGIEQVKQALRQNLCSGKTPFRHVRPVPEAAGFA
jgi:hypothetical protein